MTAARDMRRCGGAALEVLEVLVVLACVAGRGARAGGRDPEPEDAGDTAEFAVAVEGEGATRCAGALVALRAALTSARCARAPELWVRAAGARAAPAAVRVLRVAVADIHADSVAGADGDWVWGGVGADLALLELEDAVRGTRPILAAVGGECEARAACYVPRARARRLRVVPVALEPAARCVGRGARWPSALHERTLCLLGARLCGSDWGSAVVCGGKLCGVVSRSAQSDEREEQREDEVDREERRRDSKETRCGNTHAAASVPRAHRFMRCAMLRGACGRGECERVCAERWLHGEPTSEAPSAPPASHRAPSRVPPAPPAAIRRTHHDDTEDSSESEGSERGGSEAEPEASASTVTATDARVTAETRGEEGGGGGEGERAREDAETTSAAAAREEPAGAGAGAGAEAGAASEAPRAGPSTEPCGATRTGHASIEFEPNRADFKMTPARTTAVCLKAGEYGDNAADYGAGAAEEGAAGTCTPSPAPTAAPPAAPTRTSPSPAVLRAEMEARVSSAPLSDDELRAMVYSRAPPPRALSLPLLLAAACLLE